VERFRRKMRIILAISGHPYIQPETKKQIMYSKNCIHAVPLLRPRYAGYRYLAQGLNIKREILFI
jgi:hypothetical protein